MADSGDGSFSRRRFLAAAGSAAVGGATISALLGNNESDPFQYIEPRSFVQVHPQESAEGISRMTVGVGHTGEAPGLEELEAAEAGWGVLHEDGKVEDGGKRVLYSKDQQPSSDGKVEMFFDSLYPEIVEDGEGIDPGDQLITVVRFSAEDEAYMAHARTEIERYHEEWKKSFQDWEYNRDNSLLPMVKG